MIVDCLLLNIDGINYLLSNKNCYDEVKKKCADFLIDPLALSFLKKKYLIVIIK